jgi:conjugal transfer pilus assembly protein TraW
MHIGTVGRVYPVEEPDTLAEVREAAAQVDWNKAMHREKIIGEIKRFRPDGLHSLPAAREDKVSQVDMTYTLDMDIPDGKGGVLYPKGYSFNPLDYLNLSSILVVIDADDSKQVGWFKSSAYAEDYRTRLLLSGGGYYDLSEELKRPVFYLQNNVARRLQLSAVPSVVRQSGRKLEVTEVKLDD